MLPSASVHPVPFSVLAMLCVGGGPSNFHSLLALAKEETLRWLNLHAFRLVNFNVLPRGQQEGNGPIDERLHSLWRSNLTSDFKSVTSITYISMCIFLILLILVALRQLQPPNSLGGLNWVCRWNWWPQSPIYERDGSYVRVSDVRILIFPHSY